MAVEFDTSKLQFSKLAENIRKTVVLNISQLTYDKAYEGSEVHTQTGRLTSALYNRKAGKEGRKVGVDPKRAPYGIYVLLGTRPHVIKPKEKKALRWVSGDGFAFAKEVNHPGYEGDQYLFRAGDEALEKFDDLVDEALREADNASL